MPPVLPSIRNSVQMKHWLIFSHLFADTHLPNMPMLRFGMGPRFAKGHVLTFSAAVPDPDLISDTHVMDGVFEYGFDGRNGLRVGVALGLGGVFNSDGSPNLFGGATLGYAWGRHAAIPDAAALQ